MFLAEVARGEKDLAVAAGRLSTIFRQGGSNKLLSGSFLGRKENGVVNICFYVCASSFK